MKHTISLAFCLLFFTVSSVFAQIIQREKIGHQRIPVFKSQADSATYYNYMANMFQSDSKEVRDKKKLDSLAQLESRIFALVIGHKTVYYPQYDYTLTDTLKPSSNLNSIKKVSVSNKSSIPDIVWKCKEVEDIEFVNCSIKRLPGKLSRLKKLKTVRVYSSDASKPLKLGKNKVVTQLIFNGNTEQNLPLSYKKFRNVQILDLSENELTRFPNGSRKNKKLKELGLQRNKIDLSSPIKKHPYLERLALHENNIGYVPASITQFKNLKKLNCNRNKIDSVNNAIGTMQSLESVSFYGNQLTAIPKGIYDLKNLKEIDLFHNQIDVLEPEFTNWQKLEILYLSHNKLVSLPDNIDTLKNLEGLYVWDNRLGSIPESIGNIKALKYIRLNQNYLKEIPSSLLTLKDLEEIDFAHNYLTSISVEIFDLPKLKILSLSVNPWNNTVLPTLLQKVNELRAKEVFVHFGDKD